MRGGTTGATVAARVAELEREARVDDLTGVLNRRHWLAAVLSRADEALYEAKRAGRGRAVRY